MIGLINWWNGWRRDHDGWWVRARRPGDKFNIVGIPSSRGFVEEASVVVSTPEDCRFMDRHKMKIVQLKGEPDANE